MKAVSRGFSAQFSRSAKFVGALGLAVSLSACSSLGLGKFELGKELNDSAKDSPYPSQLIEPERTEKMPERYLASGITYDWDRAQFIMLSDHPHGWNSHNFSTLMVMDSSLKKAVMTSQIPSDSDLEGLAYAGNDTFYAISESGQLYTFSQRYGTWWHEQTLPALNGIAQKVSSMAIDPEKGIIYTAEKRGKKNLYALDFEGNLLSSTTLALPQNAANASLDEDFTISGLSYENGKLLILSEAYSSVFVYDLSKQQIVAAIGLANSHEMSGITISQGKVVTAGDFEDYLPAPVFSVFDKQLILR